MTDAHYCIDDLCRTLRVEDSAALLVQRLGQAAPHLTPAQTRAVTTFLVDLQRLSDRADRLRRAIANGEEPPLY
jgi:hypothetical protein